MTKAKFYADENVEPRIVNYLRENGIKVDYAMELGFKPRDDQFHLQEARRRKSILLTRDGDFLDNRKFPYHNLKDTAVIVIKTDERTKKKINNDYMLVALEKIIAKSGNKILNGCKIEIKGARIIYHERANGKIRHEEFNLEDPMTFEDKD